MALSAKVQESLGNAESELRNALSYAARQERPMVCSGISEMLSRIDVIQKMDTLIDQCETDDDQNNPLNAFFKNL